MPSDLVAAFRRRRRRGAVMADCGRTRLRSLTTPAASCRPQREFPQRPRSALSPTSASGTSHMRVGGLLA